MVFGRGFVFTETDFGTKRQARLALSATARKLHVEFMKAAREYWIRVWEVARTLCHQYGAFDTGTLYDSIRLIWVTEPFSTPYEVVVSSQGVEMTATIKVGGMGFINPKTGRFIDYAQAVHDGTRYMAARPFLTDAIAYCEGYLQELLARHVDLALQEFERGVF